MSSHILVVDDDPQITTFLERYLGKQGFQVTCAATGAQMRDVLATGQIDLCVLDVGLPDANGFDLTREIRADSNLPIIVLSVRDEAFDRVFGLEFGADDYITKPFEPRELAARIRSVLRRSQLAPDAPGPHATKETSQLQFGTWAMNVGERLLTSTDTGATAELTSMEFDLLHAFAQHPRVVLTRNQLIDLARGAEAIVGDRAIDVHIMRLRKKIEPDASEPRYIKTIHGVGYCLAQDVKRSKLK